MTPVIVDVPRIVLVLVGNSQLPLLRQWTFDESMHRINGEILNE